MTESTSVPVASFHLVRYASAATPLLGWGWTGRASRASAGFASGGCSARAAGGR